MKHSLQEIAGWIDGFVAAKDGHKVFVKSLQLQGKACTGGALFAAVRGGTRDGHDFINQAFSAGAVAALVEREEALSGRPGIVVANTSSVLSELGSRFYGAPSKELTVIGVTGTNGKTTIHWMLFHLLGLLGSKAFRIGTLGIASHPDISDDSLTTPDGFTIESSLRSAVDEGCRSAAMEVSSHGLSQGRVAALHFDAAIFTNLTRDHLDYHGDMERYYLAKRKLFERLAESEKPKRVAVINIDSEYGARLAEDLRDLPLDILTFGASENSKVRISKFTQSTAGSTLIIATDGQSYTIQSSFIGEHNASNMASVFATLLALGYDGSRIAGAFSLIPQVPGRLESVGANGIAVYVDYAHTPDALENVLTALGGLEHGKLWVIFGCGGDRDRGKRPMMAKIAEQLADCVVVTSDNPRTEDPQKIIDDILASGCTAAIVDPDRSAAIRRTLAQAKPGDMVLIAGKGHESYQIVGTEKRYFSDQDEVRSYFKAA